MGIVKKLILWPLGLFALTVIAITITARCLKVGPEADFGNADVIVVFGAGMSADGTLHLPSKYRVARGVELFKAGKAPNIHFTGGRAVPGGPAAGDQMAAMAIDLGVPDATITREVESLSTLQNALFSAGDLAQHNSAILVTEGFHLPRAAVAILWSGGPSNIQLAPSTKFRGGVRTSTVMVVREAAAWWFNTVRATAYTLGGWVGVTQGTREGWLD